MFLWGRDITIIRLALPNVALGSVISNFLLNAIDKTLVKNFRDHGHCCWKPDRRLTFEATKYPARFLRSTKVLVANPESK